MKRISNTRQFIEFILIMFCSYLLISGVIALIGGHSYRYVLCSNLQWIGVLFVYWWLPFPRINDIEQHNKNIR